MSQPSQDRVSEPAAGSQTAKLLPSERPLSELQRAVQARAQQDMDRARERANSKPNPARRIAMFALALIPVALLFTAVDGLMRVFHHINYIYNSPDAVALQAQPEPPPPINSSAEPGMVLLQPLQDTSKAPPPPQ
jgi:hypothetical protein